MRLLGSSAARAVAWRPLGGVAHRGLSQKVSREVVLARRPKVNADGSRFIGRAGLDGESFFSRVIGRYWRGVPIDVNYSFGEWTVHERASRHLSLWGPGLLVSQTLRRLLMPDLVLIAACSQALVWHNVKFGQDPKAQYVEQPGWDLLLHPDMVTLPTEPFSLSGFALGLLVTFRMQSCHGRYVEARQLWGAQLNLCRDLSSRFLVSIPPDTPALRRERARAIRLLSSFALTLKYQVTPDGGNQHIVYEGRTAAEVRRDIDGALRDEVRLLWADGLGEADAGEEFVRELIECPPNGRPLHVLHELGSLVGRMRDSGVVDRITCATLDERLLALSHVLGGCERIVRTPIYTPYTHHLSRFLLLWCTMLPACLYPIVGPAGTTPVALVLSFFMLGIEDIGSRIEQPFDSLPLWQYCDILHGSVMQNEAHDARRRARTMATPTDFATRPVPTAAVDPDAGPARCRDSNPE